MRLDPVSLRLLVAVMEEGTIADAAAREHLAASAVSKRLSELEDALSTQLFLRNNKGVSPTPAAYTLLNLARGVLNNLDDIVSQMAHYSAGVRGHVRIAANISSITQFLPQELKSFLAKYPKVNIQLKEQISSAAAKAVAENAADIALITTGSYGGELELLPYHNDELVVVAPDGHPLTRKKSTRLKDALAYDFVGAHPGSAINNLLINLANEADRSLKLRIQVTSFDALCLMVAHGLGIGVLPHGSAKVYLKPLGIKAVPLDEPWAKRRLVIAVRSYQSLTTASRQLVDHLRADGLSPS